MSIFGNCPNMSHCVMNNLLQTFNQVNGGLTEAEHMDDLQLSSEERRHFDELVGFCEQFIQEHERLTMTEEEEPEME